MLFRHQGRLYPIPSLTKRVWRLPRGPVASPERRISLWVKLRAVESRVLVVGSVGTMWSWWLLFRCFTLDSPSCQLGTRVQLTSFGLTLVSTWSPLESPIRSSGEGVRALRLTAAAHAPDAAKMPWLGRREELFVSDYDWLLHARHFMPPKPDAIIPEPQCGHGPLDPALRICRSLLSEQRESVSRQPR